MQSYISMGILVQEVEREELSSAELALLEQAEAEQDAVDKAAEVTKRLEQQQENQQDARETSSRR